MFVCLGVSVCVSVYICVREHTSSQTYWLEGCLYSSLQRKSKQESYDTVQMSFPEGMYKTVECAGNGCFRRAGLTHGIEQERSGTWGGGDTRAFHSEHEAASDSPCFSRNLPLWPAVYGRNMQAERKTVLPRGRKKQP